VVGLGSREPIEESDPFIDYCIERLCCSHKLYLKKGPL
jgi:hypothetical protein